MSINSLYNSWSERIRQLFPGLRITRHRNLVWLLVGIYRSKSIHLSKIAGIIPGTVTLLYNGQPIPIPLFPAAIPKVSGS